MGVSLVVVIVRRTAQMAKALKIRKHPREAGSQNMEARKQMHKFDGSLVNFELYFKRELRARWLLNLIMAS